MPRLGASQTFNWAFSGALEVYNITQCGDYPAGAFVTGSNSTFYNVTLFDQNFVQTNPAWTVSNDSAGLTPQCNYGGSLPDQTTLSY